VIYIFMMKHTLSSSTTSYGYNSVSTSGIGSRVTSGTISSNAIRPNGELRIGNHVLDEKMIEQMLLLLEAIELLDNDSDLKNAIRWVKMKKSLEDDTNEPA